MPPARPLARPFGVLNALTFGRVGMTIRMALGNELAGTRISMRNLHRRFLVIHE